MPLIVEPVTRDPAAPAGSTIDSAEPGRRVRPGSRVALTTPITTVLLLVVLAVASGVRLWHFNDVGYNSDEAVYAGQGASIAHDAALSPFFPVFRAHPLLFQSIVSIGYQFHWGDWYGRFAAIVFGVLTVLLVFELGRLVYGRGAGLIAASVMAIMPYHVVVTRQVLLDGPQTFCTTLTLYLLARYAASGRRFWLLAAGSGMGLAVLAKEPTILFCGAVFAFFALAPQVRVRLRDLLLATAVMAITIIPYPLAIAFSGRSRTGGNFLAWQLFRRPNHSLLFYPLAVPSAIGLATCATAVVGLVIRWRRRRWTWRETLLVSWVIVPALFFELWPVKGFQYLLPCAPAVAVLCAGALVLPTTPFWSLRLAWLDTRWLPLAGAALIAVSLGSSTFRHIRPSTRATFLAGSGGVPGGRELGTWMRTHVPEGATFLAVGPSMANLVQFYGHRKAYGLSVSSNPLHRNPAYEPLPNADNAIRNGEVQYIVWDAYSASRTRFFSARLQTYQSRYHGRVVFTHTVPSGKGGTDRVPVIVVYAVRP